MREGAAVAAQAAHEGEHMFAHYAVHLGGSEVLEVRPAQVLVVAAFGIVAHRVDAALDRLAQADGLVLFQGVQIVEPALEQQVGDLLDHLDGVGNAAGPESVPDGIDLAAEFACEHGGCGGVPVRVSRRQPRSGKSMSGWNTPEALAFKPCV